MPIEQEGATYYSAAEIAEQFVTPAVKALETKYEPIRTEAQTLASKLAETTGKLAEVSGSHERYRACATAGFADPDTAWALEQAHTRAMGSVEDSAKVDFPSWLTTVREAPDLAPAYLRPLLAGATTAPKLEGTVKAPDKAQEQAPDPKGVQGQPQPQGRPSWAPSVAGQKQVNAGQNVALSERTKEAKTLDEIIALRDEVFASRRR